MERVAAIVILVATAVLVLSSSSLLTWAEFDRTREIGPVEYTLKADADPIGFSYEMSTRPAGGGIIGGGGLGANVTIDRQRKSYPEARGEFLDNLGIIYASYRTVSYEYELIMYAPPEGSVEWDTGSPSVYLRVNMTSDLIPFWPTNGKTGMEIRVDLIGHDLMDQIDTSDFPEFKVVVDSISVVGKMEMDPETGSYTGEEVVLFESDEGWTLKDINDSAVVDLEVEYPQGAKVLGLFARIEAHMTDFWGRSQRTSLTGNSRPINIYPVDNGSLIRGAGIPLSVVLIALSVIVSLLSILLISRRSPMYRPMVIISGLLALAGVIWFYSGMLAAVDLLGERLQGAQEGLSFGPGLFIALASGLLMVLLGVASYVIPKLTRAHDKGSDRFTVVK